MKPDEWFTRPQMIRLRQLLAKTVDEMTNEEWNELEALVDAELMATIERLKSREKKE